MVAGGDVAAAGCEMSSEAISFKRSQLANAERVVFVLSVNLGSEALEQPFAGGGGNVLRVATEPITVTVSGGGEVAFSSGLLDIPNVPSEAERTGFSDAGPSVPLEVILPGVNVAKEWAAGRRFARARGELAAVTVDVQGRVQQTWENRLRQAEGYLSQPVFGDPQLPPGWMSFTLEDLAYDDVGVVNDPGAIIDEISWPEALAAVKGKVYPIVIGEPGVYISVDGTTRLTSGSPAYPVTYTASDVDKILISDGEVVASSVRVFDESGASDDLAVTIGIDGRGRTVSTVDISGGSISRTDTQYFICWNDGGGLKNPFAPGALRTLGSVAAWLLTKTSKRVDYPKWAANLDLLGRARIDTYFNDPEQTPMEVLQRLLESLPSVSVRMGLDGLYPLIRRMEIPDEAAVHKVTEGPDFIPEGPLTTQTGQADIRNRFTTLYAPRARTGDLKRSMTCTPDPGDERSSFATEYAVISASRYDTTATETIELPFIYDETSAELIVAENVRIRGFGYSTGAFRANHLYGWIEVGQVILFTSDRLHLTDQFVEVLGKRPIEGGWMFLLAFDDDPVRNAPKRYVAS